MEIIYHTNSLSTAMQRRKQKGFTRNKKNTDQAFLLWLIIVSGDVELHPGPVSCMECNKNFDRQSRLDNHLKKCGTVFTCHRCNTSFDRQNFLVSTTLQIYKF